MLDNLNKKETPIILIYICKEETKGNIWDERYEKREIIRCDKRVEMKREKWAGTDEKKKIKGKREVVERERWEGRGKKKR